ncbi:uncharacterized protein B0T23DRAFT_155278 [Neurospora hispaniola]|uniref:Apple domain-containing protein n=1 Tax=Neurospora hispaniola TaxID=588809 RepID=A0AAJ0MRW3_9PEZI|nr:hypothetical protein B0T23DRAFT_155278 [Neurospora hispaniola]
MASYSYQQQYPPPAQAGAGHPYQPFPGPQQVDKTGFVPGEIQHPYPDQGTPMLPEKNTGAGSGSTLLTVKRSIALAVIGTLALLLATVIGLAAGLGVSQKNLHDAKNNLKLAQASITAGLGAITSSPTIATATSTSTSSASSTATTIAKIECPSINGTFYTATVAGNSSSPGGSSSKKFQRLCGVDFGKGEAADIGSVNTTSFNSCLDKCAEKQGCTGAGWGAITGDEETHHTCWMKTNLTTKGHEAVDEWAFGVLELSGSGKGEDNDDGDDNDVDGN